MVELKDVEFMTAQDKARVLRQWEGFLKGGLKWEQFHSKLYEHLHLHCGFIGHYNRRGFYLTCFQTGTGVEDFIYFFNESIRQQATYINWDYQDINTAMAHTLAKYSLALLEQARQSQRDADIAKALRLLSKHEIPLQV